MLPSTREVSRVTLAAFLRPAGSASPIRSSLSRKNLPPFLDFALEKEQKLVHDINVFESLISSARRNGLVEISENAKMTGAWDYGITYPTIWRPIKTRGRNQSWFRKKPYLQKREDGIFVKNASLFFLCPFASRSRKYLEANWQLRVYRRPQRSRVGKCRTLTQV